MQRGMQFSGSVVHRLLLCELHHGGPTDEMRFMLGKHSIHFSRVEFCLITGLKFRAIPDTTLYEDVENGIHHRYFGAVSFTELQARIEHDQWQEQFDAVKLCLQLMVNCVLTGLDEQDFVHIWQLRLVDDLDAFNVFPWGSHVNKYSIFGFKKALQYRNDRYNIFGFANALLVFAFEVIPTLATQFATPKEVEPLPHILKWELTRNDHAAIRRTRVRFRMNTGVVPPPQMVGSDAPYVGVESTCTKHARGGTRGHTERRSHVREILHGHADDLLLDVGHGTKLIWKGTTQQKRCKVKPELIHITMVPKSRVPLQSEGGNCGAHILLLIEHTLVKKKFEWTHDNMVDKLMKMAVEACLFVVPDLVAHATLAMILVKEKLAITAWKRQRVNTPSRIVSDFGGNATRCLMLSSTTQVLGCPTGMIGTEYALTSVSLL
ncbi:hypothetical protein Dsin_002180 [Dipteronia sinensis]|uniref:DUF1985 domain-containing protein n=1 Tax=Dipteronia sinensis TaxID=43782 RepID=A0AAE0B6Z9_9ROSI|nr:hypothetical protein Dsin_002180 [Dipteronia sinensis]